MIDPENIQDCHIQSLDSWNSSKKGKAPTSHVEFKKYQQLNSAIRNGKKELAISLIELGTPVNANLCLCDRRQVSPLHLAVQLGCPDLIVMLLENGASVNAQWKKETPLTLSVRLRKFSIADILLTVDELLNSEESGVFGLSHFHIACLRGHIVAARRLIRMGADVNEAVREKSFFWSGYTPLHFAVECQSTEIVQLLLDCGASLKAKDARSFTALHLAHELRNEAIIDVLLAAHMYEFENPVDLSGLSHFHIACTRNNPSIVEFFLKQGCDVNSGDWDRLLPLNLAIEYECPDVVESLLLHNAKVIDHPMYRGNILCWAYFIGNERIINLLISNNNEIDRNKFIMTEMHNFHRAFVQFDEGKITQLLNRPHEDLITILDTPIWHSLTPLHIAVMQSSVEVVRLLRICGANVTMQDRKLRTPLHLAFEYASEDDLVSMIDDLISIEENPADSHGLTHFHIACTTNRVDLIRRFLEHGVNVEQFVNDDVMQYSGYGPLHFATEFDQLAAVDILLDHGTKIFIDVESENGTCGWSPVDIAILKLNKGLTNTPKRDDERLRLKILQRILTVLEESSSENLSQCRGFSLLHILCASKEVDYSVLKKYLDSHPETLNQIIKDTHDDHHGCAPIHIAIENGNVELVKWLVQNGADIHLKDGRGLSPFEVDLTLNGKYGIFEANSKILCDSGNPVDALGYSYFHIGCILGNIDVMQFHIDAGVDVNLPTEISVDGYYCAQTPLHVVLQDDINNVIDTVSYLLKNNADPAARDAYLNTPLHGLGYISKFEIIELLVSHGCNVNAQNIFGQTPLLSLVYRHSAEVSVTKKMIVTLLDLGADINLMDNAGETPLTFCHVLILGDEIDEWEECVTILLKHAKKIELLGRELSDVNKKSRSKLFTDWQIQSFRRQEFEEQCLAEIERLKNTRTDRYTTLYQVLSKSPNQMASFCENLFFQEIIQSDELSKNFPIYGYLLRLQYKVGLIRKPLLEKCMTLMSRSIGLSSESSERILEYLDNTDLKNIIKSEDLLLIG
ncbi:hypothetical protein QAD02_006099 [Eretmocerus hayati]|uniref:Uncharacterized protein n=1 Tax=Eretmocerus hayati TaxID=131215 RepID=A0ACC2N276_9HYME|nr:hypothetical protein QAD02_006099 [Eretmocerus hayati]